jgi:uncharacterized membrane protein YdbT with pleckstrin-like domain
MLLEKIKLEPDEKVLLQARRHWFVIASQIVGFVLVAFLPLVVLIFLSYSLPENITLGDYVAEISYVYILLLVFLWISIYNALTNYYLDVLTVTDRRVILVNQKGFFWRNIASFRLERMQDMHIEVNGIIATILDFGNILVETAGNSTEEFAATDLPNPGRIKSIILQASDNRIASSANHDSVESI